MELNPQKRILSASDKEGTQKILSAIKTHAPTGGVGMLWAEGEDAHYAAFAGQGSHWGFYQANYSNEKDSFTLAYHLNESLAGESAKLKDWNMPSLTLVEMLGLLESLTVSTKAMRFIRSRKVAPSFDGISFSTHWTG